MIEATYQVAVLTVSLHFPESDSLKAKRQILKSIKDRTRQKFNVSMAEIDGMDKWQVATLVFVMAGTDNKYLNQTMENLLTFISGNHQSEVCEHRLEFI